MDRTRRSWVAGAGRLASPVVFALLTACSDASNLPSATSSPDASGAPEDAGPPITTTSAFKTACDLPPPAACMPPSLHYADIAPIIERSCVPCHSGADAEVTWPLTAYSDLAPWADVVRNDVCAYAMPPADGGIAISAADRLDIVGWIQCGAPE